MRGRETERDRQRESVCTVLDESWGREAYHWLGTKRENDLFSPWTTQTNKNVLVGNICHAGLGVVFGIIPENNTIDFVGGSAEPAFLDIVEDTLELGLGTCDVSHFTDGNTESSPQETAKMCSRVRELVRLATMLVQRDEDAHVVLSRKHLDRGARELGTDLIKASGCEALLRASNMEGAHGRVVRSLFG